MPFVADASATLPWCFDDEATGWTESLLSRISTGETLYVPAHWVSEVSNALVTATRRKRIDQVKAEEFLSLLESFNIVTDQGLTPERARSVLHLSVERRLTFYDAAYLELAQRLRLPLATLDRALQAAARDVEAELIPLS